MLISEEIGEHLEELAKQKEQVIIKALGTVDPELSIKLEEAADNENMDAMRIIAKRLEVEQYPDGKEVYELDGEKFLKFETEREWKDNKMTTRFIPEFIKE